MNKQEIEKHLRLVRQELQVQGITLDLLLLGGAATLIEVGNRESTQDVSKIRSFFPDPFIER